MALYHLTEEALTPVATTDFSTESLMERQDIQRLLKDNIGALADDLFVIAEEYGEFQDSKRRIDLLAIDRDANLVVIELKRTADGGYMELQAIRYAAMIAYMTWAKVIEAYSNYSADETNAEQVLLEFLGWEEPKEDEFGNAVRIILASADFSKEITTSVLWLNEMDLDITCVRLNLYKLNGELILNAEQIIPLPETETYQIGIREKRRNVKEAIKSGKDRSTYTLTVNGQAYESGFIKADIGFITVQALSEHKLIDQESFAFLRNNKSCRVPLLKTESEITESEKKYGKYRFKHDPELIYGGEDFYIARNWSVNGAARFTEAIATQFPNVEIKKD